MKPRYRITFIPDDKNTFDYFSTMYNYYTCLNKRFIQMFMIPFSDKLLIIYRKIN